MASTVTEWSKAVAASQALFGRGSLDDLSAETLLAALGEAGLHAVRGALPPIGVLLKEAGLVASANEARRTIAEGGAYLNNERVTDGEAVPGEADWLPGGWLVLRRGRRTVAGVHRTGA